MAFFVFPSSWSASTFLIALATGFPVTVLTWSGVAGVNKAYFDVARTLGASPAFLVLRVAVPAALPHVFVGLFMGLGGAFAVLVVACQESTRSRRRNSRVMSPEHISAITISAAYMLA
jgi:NitT/TauT family transport system permease protein